MHIYLCTYTFIYIYVYIMLIIKHYYEIKTSYIFHVMISKYKGKNAQGATTRACVRARVSRQTIP